MKKLLALASFLGFTLFWACHLGPEDDSNRFDVVGDTAWTRCDTLELQLLDDTGKVLDILFRDSLRSVGQLKGLDAGSYKGGDVRIRIYGTYRDGSVCVDQTRTFEAGGTRVKIDTLVDPSALPDSIVADPEFLSLVGGGGAQTVKGRVLPAYVDQGLYWSMDSSGVASLDAAADAPVREVSVTPEALGEGYLTLRSRKDGRKTLRVRVRVSPTAAASVSLDHDSLLLYAFGPKATLEAVVLPHLADPSVSWSSADPTVAKVDAAGQVTPGAAGRTVIRAVTGNGMRDSAVVEVVSDVPRLTVAHKPGAPVNEIITFSPTVTQKVGHLVLYAWDLQGDGAWDDSLPLQLYGDSVELQQQAARFAREGVYHPRFRVRDSEGNMATTEVTVDIGNQAPEISGLRGDMVLSILDSIAMTATARDQDGKVAWVGWDFDGDGQFDDTLEASDTEVEVVMGHRYLEAGNYLAVFRAVDGNGKSRQDTVRIRVELDEPVADAGEDFTVLVGGDIRLHAGGSDGLGTIVRREYRAGDTAFTLLSSADTVLKAPLEPEVIDFVIRVTDDDGLFGLDTVQVTVVLSSNSDLTGLALSAGSLVPAFKPETGVYNAQVAYGDSLVRITATARDPAAELTVNGADAVSGLPSEPVLLTVGENPSAFRVQVASPDGSARTYLVSVSRVPNADATLKALAGTGFAIRPAFAPGVLDYRDTVAAAVPGITLRPTVAFVGATVTVNDVEVASGTPTPTLPLQFGDNLFRVVVTAADKASRTTYAVRVVRRAKLYIHRKLGSAAAVLADSAEMPPGVARPLSSPGATGHTFSRWSMTEGSAVLADSAANPTVITLGAGLVRVQAAFTVNRYTLTASATGCGTLNPAPGTSSHNHGANVAYTLTPSAGCRIRSVRVDGAEDTSGYDGSYAFANLSANHTLAVTFARTYTLTGSVAGSGGTIVPAAALLVDSGTSHTYVIDPDNGKKIFSLKDNGAAVATTTSYVLQGISANHHVEVVFAGGFTLTATVALGAGTISPTSVGVDSGASQVFRFRPAANYRFLGLTDNGAAASPIVGDTQYTLAAIREAHALQVRFRRLFTLGVTARGCGSVSAGGGTVDSASTHAFSFTPAAGCKVDSVFVNNGSIGPASAYTFNPIAQNSTLRVVFTRMFSIATTWGTSGNNHVGGSISPANPSVDSMDAQTFTLGVGIGYRRLSLAVNGSPVSPVPSSYTFPAVTANQSLQLTLIRTFNQTSSLALGAGNISPSLATVDTLGSQLFTFSPSANYRFHTLLVNGAAVPPTGGTTQHTLSGINRDNAVQVRFWRQYNIAVTSSGCGTVSPSGGLVDSASSPVYAFTLPTGCTVDTLIADGARQTSANSHTFANVTANHSLRVVFRQAPGSFTVTTTWGTSGDNRVGGSITPANPSVVSGQSVTLAINPLSGYRRLSFAVNGTPITPVPASHTIPSVTAPMTAHAAFLRTFTITTSYTGTGCGTVPAGGVRDSASNNSFPFTLQAGCKVDSLFVNGTSVSPATSYAFNNLSQNQALRAVFVNTYSVTTTWATTGTAGIGGSVTPANPLVDAGDPVTLSILPSAGYRRYAYRVNGNPVPQVTPTYTFASVTAAQSFHADFWRVFKVTGMAVPGGSVTPAQSDIDSAGIANLTVTPTPGYVIDTVWDNKAVKIVDGGAVAIPYVIRGVDIDHEVVASFKRRLNFKVSIAGAGTAEPMEGEIKEGADRRIDFTAGPGSVMIALTDNGKDVLDQLEGNPGSKSSYTILRAVANHDIQAVYERRNMPGFRLTLSDSLVLREGETPPEKPARLCVTWDGPGGSGEQCGEPGVAVTIPEGSDVRVEAQKSVEVCGPQGCEERLFAHWHVRSGKEETDVPENPATLKVTAVVAIRAVYGPKLIIQSPINLETQPQSGLDDHTDP